MPLRFLAVSGSLRATSSTSALLRALAAMAPAGVEVELYSGLGDLPWFDPDLDLDPTDYRAPAPVLDLRARIAAADGLIICTPEYAYGMPGVLKNALDWVVSMGVIEAKPVAALAASPSNSGGEKAYQGLLWVLTALNTRVLPEASFTVPRIRQKLGPDGAITDPGTARSLRSVLDSMVAAVAGKQGTA